MTVPFLSTAANPCLISPALVKPIARVTWPPADHQASGRTAAYFMARMLKASGPAAVLCNRFCFQSHEERVRGFREGLERYAPALKVSDVIEGGDSSVRSERLLSEVFRRNPGIAGFYNVGAANDACDFVL